MISFVLLVKKKPDRGYKGSKFLSIPPIIYYKAKSPLSWGFSFL